MLDQIAFGKRVRAFRLKDNYSQKEVALRIGVSEQAVSKWENGECLPDVYNLKLLAQVLRVSADRLLDTEVQGLEKIVETIMVGGARFEIIEKPETIFTGKILCAKDFPDIDHFYAAIDSLPEEEKQAAFAKLKEPALPVCDVHMSVNFWLDADRRAYGFVREVLTENQPNGVEVYKMPASLFIRACTDRETSRLVCREQCEMWQLFAYIREFFMPAYGFQMAQNGAQELEVFNSFAHTSGQVYMPVVRE